MILIMLILVTYRLARLISRDIIFDRFRLWMGRKAASRDFFWLNVAELFHCPHCLGIWIAALLAIAPAHSFYEWFLYTLAIAGGQSFLQSWVDHA